MADVIAAHRAYKQADQDALAMRRRARVRLGRAVAEKIDSGYTIVAIAKELDVVDEQVRRYRQAYLDWLRDHPGEDLAATG